MPPLPTPDPYPHWMLREIYEQPATLAATLDRYVLDGGFRAETCGPILDWLTHIQPRLLIAASGSSRHAGLLAEQLIEELSDLHVDVEYSSEYIFRPESSLANSAVVVVSQSGETADTLAALRKSTLTGQPTLAITNVEHSRMDREATVSFPTLAGRERAIPATKSFTAQLLNLYLFALMTGVTRGTLYAADLRARLDELARLPQQIESQLPGWDKTMRSFADQYRDARSFLFLGRGPHYPIAREGSLKLKESAYLHAEGYPSGELKHGPNALVDASTPLVMIATLDPNSSESLARYDKVLLLLREMREQGANILALANTGDTAIAELATHTVFVEPASEPLLTISEVIPLQLFAYWMAVGNGIDVDHPRNLSKAVLVD